MKPLRITAAAAVLSILLTGCSSQKNPSAGNTDPAQTNAPESVQDGAGDETGDPSDADPDLQFDGTDDELLEADPDAEQEPQVDQGAFEWRIRPFLEADDISPLSIGPGLGTYGDFTASDFLLITRGGKVGLMTRDGGIIIEPECAHAYNYVQEDGDRHIIFTDGDPDSGDRICFCVTTGALLRTADQVCTLCGGQLKNAGDRKAAVYDPESGAFGMMPADLVWQAKLGDQIQLDGLISASAEDISNTFSARSMTLPDGFGTETTGGTGIMNGSCGVIRNGRMMTSFRFDSATDFKDGVAAFCQDGKWGYLNTAGRMVLPFEYDADFTYTYAQDGTAVKLPYLPSEGYIALNQGDNAGYSNLKGERVVAVGTFAETRPVCDGQAWVKEKSTGLWGVIALGSSVTGDSPAERQEVAEDTQPTFYHAENGEGWQQAYAEVLRSDGTGETLQFSLCMVDGDDVPELVLHWYDRHGFEQENEDVELYTYYDGRLFYLGNVACDGYCTCKYLPQKHYVLVGGMRDDVALYDFRQLENGELTTVCSFNMIMNGKEVKYMIDGNECSKDTYVSRWKELYNGDVSYDGGMYHNTEENIVGILGVEAPA